MYFEGGRFHLNLNGEEKDFPDPPGKAKGHRLLGLLTLLGGSFLTLWPSIDSKVSLAAVVWGVGGAALGIVAGLLSRKHSHSLLVPTVGITLTIILVVGRYSGVLLYSPLLWSTAVGAFLTLFWSTLLFAGVRLVTGRNPDEWGIERHEK